MNIHQKNYTSISYIIYSKGKGKVHHAPQESVGGAHFPLPGLEPVGGEPLMSVTSGQCDARPTTDQLQGITPIGLYQIILLGDRGMCVNNLPRVALDNGAAGIRTHDLLIASPARYRCATKPHVHIQ